MGDWLEAGKIARIGESVTLGGVEFTLDEVVYRERGIYGVGTARVKDAKDVEGDKQGHVHTLYTLFGTRVANWVTTVCVCVAALLPAILLHLHELLYYCVAACLLFLLEVVFVKNRRLLEALVVLLYYAYLLVLFYFLSHP